MPTFIRHPRLSQDQLWQKLAEKVHGEFKHAHSWLIEQTTVRVQHDTWIITLDHFTAAEPPENYLRIRTPFINKDGFHFHLHPKTLLGNLVQWMGLTLIQTGNQQIDNKYSLQANQPEQLIALVLQAPIKQRLLNIQDVNIRIQTDDGWFHEHFPEGVDELCLWTPQVSSLKSLESIFCLFTDILHYLCHIDSAYEADPHINIQ